MTAELHVVVAQDNTLWSRLGRWLGLITWNHALVRFWMTSNSQPPHYHIIEAGFSGVVERDWKPLEYLHYAAFRLRSPCTMEQYFLMLEFARKQVGKRYAFEMLPAILVKVIKQFILKFIGQWQAAGMVVLEPGHVCTSLVDSIFYAGGIDLVPDDPTPLVSADDIAESPLLEEIERR